MLIRCYNSQFTQFITEGTETTAKTGGNKQRAVFVKILWHASDKEGKTIIHLKFSKAFVAEFGSMNCQIHWDFQIPYFLMCALQKVLQAPAFYIHMAILSKCLLHIQIEISITLSLLRVTNVRKKISKIRNHT